MDTKDLVSRLDSGIKSISGYVGIIMISIGTHVIFAHNVLRAPVPWTDEILKMLFAWFIFVCSSLIFMGGGLIGLDLIQEEISNNKKAYGGLRILQCTPELVPGILTTNWGLNIILMQLSTNEKTAVVRHPLWMINMGFLIGGALPIISVVWKVYGCRKYSRDDIIKTE